jgi:hypothetical protein
MQPNEVYDEVIHLPPRSPEKVFLAQDCIVRVLLRDLTQMDFY